MKIPLVVTTGLRSAKDLEEQAIELSRQLHAPYIKREKNSLEAIKQQVEAAAVLVMSREKLALVLNDKELFFHPGLAKLRIKEIQAGKTDQMIKAMDLKEGDSLLDCTLGLASDAIVASFMVGPGGKVVGLEDSYPLSEIVRRGLQSYSGEKLEILNAMRRIQVINVNHLNHLRELPSNSYDVVYFDPMFRVPREKSSSMAPLRPLANSDPLSGEAVKEAVRVARKRVVMKENTTSQEFNRLKFDFIQGGRYSPVAYGVICKVVP